MNLDALDPKLIVLTAVVILVIAVLAWLYVRKRRSTTADLRQRFGPEYERAVLEHGSERKAEAKLADREKRVEKLKIRDLDPWSTNVFRNGGSPYSLVLSIPKRGQSQKPMTWCPVLRQNKIGALWDRIADGDDVSQTRRSTVHRRESTSIEWCWKSNHRQKTSNPRSCGQDCSSRNQPANCATKISSHSSSKTSRTSSSVSHSGIR